jgi:hypothetical protein
MTKRLPPPARFNEAEAVASITGWIDIVAELLTKEASRARLREGLRAGIETGSLTLERLIEMADAGQPDADAALRDHLVTLNERGEIDRQGPMIRDFLRRSLRRPPVTAAPGRNFADTLQRDVGICVLVELTVARWQLPPSRNRASKRPAATTLVARALNKRGHKLTEWQVAKICSGGLRRVEQRLSTFSTDI